MRIFARAIQPVAALATLGAPARPSAPVGLLVDGVSNPLAIDGGTARPVEYGAGVRPPQYSGLFHGTSFAWMTKDDRRSERQTAYQSLVASTPDRLAPEKADCWDSGKVDSDQSASVEYAGKRLWPAKSSVKDPGVLAVSEEDSAVKCLVGSGTHRFKAAP